MTQDKILIEALEKIRDMKRLPGETTDTYCFNRCWNIATEALARHSQHSGQQPVNTKEEAVVDMTAEEFWAGGMFKLDFLPPQERETIIKATELYGIGKTRVKDQQIQKLKSLIEEIASPQELFNLKKLGKL